MKTPRAAKVGRRGQDEGTFGAFNPRGFARARRSCRKRQATLNFLSLRVSVSSRSLAANSASVSQPHAPLLSPVLLFSCPRIQTHLGLPKDHILPFVSPHPTDRSNPCWVRKTRKISSAPSKLPSTPRMQQDPAKSRLQAMHGTTNSYTSPTRPRPSWTGFCPASSRTSPRIGEVFEFAPVCQTTHLHSRHENPVLDTRYWRLLADILTPSNPAREADHSRALRPWLIPLLNRIPIPPIILSYLELLSAGDRFELVQYKLFAKCVSILWPLAVPKFSPETLLECFGAVIHLSALPVISPSDGSWGTLRALDEFRSLSIMVESYRTSLAASASKRKVRDAGTTCAKRGIWLTERLA